MFNRRLIVLIILLILSLGTLWWHWQNPGGESLQTEPGYHNIARHSLALSGNWNQFDSLREAWTTESELSQGNGGQSLFSGRLSVALPSSEKISVVSKRFRIPWEWSSRTMLLNFQGVQGKAVVYLNGIAGSQKIGEFEGSGGEDELEIPAKLFRYGEDNILLVELTGSRSQRNMLLGSNWPSKGKITGGIRLDAVVETSLSSPKVVVAWLDDTTAQLTVTTNLRHHGFAQDGPWTVYGSLSDGSEGIVEQTVIVTPQENANSQTVALTLTVPEARRWTREDPFRYQLYLVVTNSNGNQDDLELSLGLHSLAMRLGKWQLNGQDVPINGTALTVETESRLRHAGGVEDWLQQQQQAGKNLIYFVGQIPDELWLNAADRLGMGVWAELPVELTPSSRLPEPGDFAKVVAAKSLHPSLWAWTVGKGLDSDSLAQAYVRKAETDVQPNLAFALQVTPVVPGERISEQTVPVQDNKLQGTWGGVSLAEPVLPTGQWPQEFIAARVLTVAMVFLVIMNVWSVTWRYKEISERKAKRRVRNAWFWNWQLAFARQILLAGLVTSGIFRVPTHSNAWLAHLWPVIDVIQLQSPWLIWAFVSILFMLIRLLHAGVVAPHLPESPHPAALVCWLERRYYFAVFIAVGWDLWPLLPWKLPFVTLILVYMFLVLLLLPIRLRDIRRIGGRYRAFLWVPGIIVGVLVIWSVFQHADWVYLWHMRSKILSLLYTIS